jgi:voltage-gated potassium channel
VRRAWLFVPAVAACFGGAAVAFSTVERVPFTTGLYWTVTTATTVGYGDVIPHNGAGRAVATAAMLVLIPLLAAVFARVSAAHVRATLRADLAELRSVAARAHRIAADTHKHVTGREHPDAPPSDVEVHQ